MNGINGRWSKTWKQAGSETYVWKKEINQWEILMQGGLMYEKE